MCRQSCYLRSRQGFTATRSSRSCPTELRSHGQLTVVCDGSQSLRPAHSPGRSICWCTCTARAEPPGSWPRRCNSVWGDKNSLEANKRHGRRRRMLKTASADIYISSRAPHAACWAGQADGNSRLLKSFVCSNVILAKERETYPGELCQGRVHLLVAGRDGLTDVCVVPEEAGSRDEAKNWIFHKWLNYEWIITEFASSFVGISSES